MNSQATTGQHDEQKMVKLYMELTGSTEAAARDVFMYLPRKPDERENAPPAEVPGAAPGKGPSNGIGHAAAAAVAVGALLCCARTALAAPETSSLPSASNPKDHGQAATQSATVTNSIFTHPVSLAEAVDVALQRNPNILRARQDVEANLGVVMQTRAVAVPKVAITGSYNAFQPSDVDVLSFPSYTVPGSMQKSEHFSFGNFQTWSSQVRLTQSLYEGGRIVSAFRSARLSKEQALLDYQTVVADTVRDVEIAYDDVLLGVDQITVQEASVELLTREWNDTTRRFEAGTVPRFNVLRARVELANEQPRLIRARNDYRIAKNNLANLLGFNVPKDAQENIPLELTGKLEAAPYTIDLPRAIALALERRTELASLRKAQALREEDLVTAKAGYKPSVQAFGGYDGHNSSLSTDLGFADHGWITGVQVNWNIFDGLLTQGRVKQRRAQLERAGVDVQDSARSIELEVRTAQSNFIEANETLQSQKENVEEAEEALRLATARSEAGTGTQLDVLSAQTALTNARVTQIQALHDYCVARARLDRAMGINLPGAKDKS